MNLTQVSSSQVHPEVDAERHRDVARESLSRNVTAPEPEKVSERAASAFCAGQVRFLMFFCRVFARFCIVLWEISVFLGVYVARRS